MTLIAAAVIALALGDAPGSWVVLVSTTGGFTGRGAGAVTVRSDGAAACDVPLQCAATAPADSIRQLASAILLARGLTWERPSSRSICNDCIVTTLTLYVRQADGTESRAVFTWDDVDAPQLPARVREIYDAAMRLGRR